MRPWLIWSGIHVAKVLPSRCWKLLEALVINLIRLGLKDHCKDKQRAMSQPSAVCLLCFSPSHSSRLWGATEGQITRLLASNSGLDRRSSSCGRFTHDHRDTVFSGRDSLALRKKNSLSRWLCNLHNDTSLVVGIGVVVNSLLLFPHQKLQNWLWESHVIHNCLSKAA